jgi:hypothetical protein
MEQSRHPLTSFRSPTTDCRTMIRTERHIDHLRLGITYRHIDLPTEVERKLVLRRDASVVELRVLSLFEGVWCL